MKAIWGLLLLAFLGVAIAFALQNNQAVELKFLAWSLSTTMALLILGAYGLGMLTGWTVLAFLRRSVRKVSERQEA